VADITPEQIPLLEAQRAERPGNPITLTRLGVAYFKLERYADARPPLDSAVQLDPRSGIAAIYLGMTTEALGDFPAARAAYQQYLALSRSRELRATAERRLRLVGRLEMEFQARQALAAESTITGTPPDENTIAVMPFTYTGTNEEIQPLTRGMAQLLITDLARSRQLRVLEREQMQAMLDEMRLGAEQRADPSTAVRSGRLLRAERVVQGSLSDLDGRLRVDATVVQVASADVATPPSQTDELSRLFDLEKALVFGIFERLGIPLTDAERAAINQRPTQNMQAFLAFSRGLEAEDRGDFEGARASYLQASQIDPSFRQAQQSATQATELSVASTQTVSQAEQVVVQNSNVEAAPIAAPAQQSALTNATEATNSTTTGGTDQTTTTTPTPTTGGGNQPTQRDPTAQTTGTERPTGTTATVRITIRRPQ
jgi:TolB-like protein